MTAPLAIAVDLGGTSIRAALITRDGKIVARHKEPSLAQGAPEAVVAQIVRAAKRAESLAENAPIAGIGICVPGPLDAEAGIALATPTVKGFQDFSLRAALAADLPWHVHLDNDAMAATRGEWYFGAGRGMQDFVYLTVSTGIGGGAVCDGRLLRGRRGMATHFGHISLSEEGPQCACGARGCFEAWASGPAFAAAAREAGFEDGMAAIGAARKQDAAALSLIADEGRLLGRGIASIVHIFSPQAVLIGGGMSAAADLLASHIRQELTRRALRPFRDVKILTSALGDDAGMIGMAMIVYENQANGDNASPQLVRDLPQ